jgi:hypothetical protein
MTQQDMLASLNPLACAAAQEVVAAGGVLTSAKRDLDAQASAMAADTVLDRQFIQNTYKHPLCPVAVALQACADANPTQDQAGLTALFLGVMAGFSDADLELLSAHLGGNAFDIVPDPSLASVCQAVVAKRLAQGGKGLFLQREGNLIRFHIQVW